MSEYSVRIERLANGYEVEITDPKVVAANRKTNRDTPWRDPKVCYAFPDVKSVLAFLNKNLEKATPMDEYSTSFDAAVKAST